MSSIKTNTICAIEEFSALVDDYDSDKIYGYTEDNRRLLINKIMPALKQLEALLCDPEGNISIAGTPENLRLINLAFTELNQAIHTQPRCNK